jgi:predicted dehydrogenase
MADNTIKCAVVGVGIMGSLHAGFLAGRPNSRLVAVADLRSAAAEAVGAKAGARVYTSYEEMLNREEIDLALVATPDHLHRAPAIACCQAGIPNLVIQKPLSTTVEDAQAILAAAHTAGTRAFMWYGNRGYGTDMATQYALRAGLIGEVVYGDCHIDDSINVPRHMWEARSRDWVTHSSPAHFLATHVLNRLEWYFAPARIKQVYAVAPRRVLGHTPDLYDAFLHFDSGLRVRLRAGWIHHIEGAIESGEAYNGVGGQVFNNRSPKFYGQKGWRLNLDPDVSCDELRHHQSVLRRRGLGSHLIQRDPLGAGWNQGIRWALEVPASEAPNRELFEFILDAVLEDTLQPASWRAWQGDQPLPTAEAAMETVRIICAMEASERTGVPVDIQ